MGAPQRMPDDEPEDVFAVAAREYGKDYEARISCLWPFVILPLGLAIVLGVLAYLVYRSLGS
jgi:hypothetical protein